ncbi:hypothetical protein D3C75_1065130 [compost metagenome]
MAVLQQERLQPGGGLAGMIEGEPPPQGIACQPVVLDAACGQLVTEPLMGLLEAGHPPRLAAAVARQIQRVTFDLRQGCDHRPPVVGIAEQAVQQHQRRLVGTSCHGLRFPVP